MQLVTRLFGEAWEHRRRRLQTTGVAAVVALTAAVVVFFGSGGGSGGGGGAPNRAGSSFDSHKIASAFVTRYADLLSHPVSAETLPKRFTEQIIPRTRTRLGLDLGDIGEAHPDRRTTVWLIPGTSGDCFVEQIGRYGGSSQCGPFPRSVFGPGWFGSGPEREAASGLVADGIDHITVHLAGGASLVVPVKDNAYVVDLRIGQGMTSLSAITPSGRVVSSSP